MKYLNTWVSRYLSIILTFWCSPLGWAASRVATVLSCNYLVSQTYLKSTRRSVTSAYRTGDFEHYDPTVNLREATVILHILKLARNLQPFPAVHRLAPASDEVRPFRTGCQPQLERDYGEVFS